MTCEEFVRLLSANNGSPASLREHADGCARCHALLELDRRLHALMQPMAALSPSPALLEVLKTHEGRTTPSAAHRRALAVVTASAASIVLVLRYLPRADIRAAMSGSFWPVFLLFAAVGMTGLSLFVYRGKHGFGVSPHVRWAFVALSIVGFEVWAQAFAHARLADVHPMPAPDCVPISIVVSLLIAVITFGISRRTISLSAMSAGALAGTVAGFAALLVVHAHCPANDAVHLQFVHGFGLVLPAACGAWAGHRWLAA